MRPFKFLKNAAGIGLVEVMMAVAVTGGLTLTIAKLMDNATQSAKQVEAKSENTNLKGLIQETLNNTTACQKTFGTVLTAANITALSGSSTASVSVPSIKDKFNIAKYYTASTNISPLSITSIEVTNYNNAAYTGDLVVQSTFKKSSNSIVMVKPIRIPINFSFTSGSLTACSTMAVGGEWMLNGNAGTSSADYLGTSDSNPLVFKINAQNAGRIDFTGNAFFGHLSGNVNTAQNNTGFGYWTLSKNTSGNLNTAVGVRALFNNTTGHSNTALGAEVMPTNTTGWSNISIGTQSMYSNSTGYANVAIGWQALFGNTTGHSNTAIGYAAMDSNSTGFKNVALGVGSLNANSTGSVNVAVGFGALASTSTGYSNVALGTDAEYSNTTGLYNVSLGDNAGRFNSTGSYNTYVGGLAGRTGGTGDFNTSLGYNSGNGRTGGSYNIFLGPSAGVASRVYNNELQIEGNSTYYSTPLIAGSFSARTAYVNGNLGVDLPVGTVPQSSLAIGTSGGTASTKLYVDFQESYAAGGKTGIYSRVNPAGYSGEWSYGIQASNYSPDTGHGSMVGLRADASAQTPGGSGRAYGAWASAGNATDGYNYGLVAMLTGTARGTAIWASSQAGDWPQSTDAFMSLNQRWAAILNGHVYVKDTIWATAHVATSDLRLKKNIKNLDGSLEKVLKLRGVSYDWKKDSAEAGPQIGLIAQEVEPLFPEVVSSKGNGKALKAVNYSALIAPIIESIKTLYAKILALITSDEKQNLEIKELKLENEKLKLEMKQQQESFDLRMKKLEAQSAKK